MKLILVIFSVGQKFSATSRREIFELQGGAKTDKLIILKQINTIMSNELVRKLIHPVKICEREPKLSQKTIREIKEARERIKKGEFYTEEESRKILGL